VLMALAAVAGTGGLAACGSGANAHKAATAAAKPAGVTRVAGPHPVYVLPPGRVTLASAATQTGPVAIRLHRMRYFGHVSLCVSVSNTQGATSQSCARYPIGPKSHQGIGESPVWWAATDFDVCTKPRFEVVAGVLLRRGISAWLHAPAGVTRMARVAIPKPFGVAGSLVYATIDSEPDRVTLRDGSRGVIYDARVQPLSTLPRAGCPAASSTGGTVSSEATGAFVLTEPGQHIVP
jgi:hypothetical protein